VCSKPLRSDADTHAKQFCRSKTSVQLQGLGKGKAYIIAKAALDMTVPQYIESVQELVNAQDKKSPTFQVILCLKDNEESDSQVSDFDI
jgi:hypothetical protein